MALELKPCPFCSGPPVPIVQNYVGGGAAPLLEDYGDEGLWIKAFVFCHECGADGPALETVIYDTSEYLLAECEAVQLWQDRGERHRDLYEASAADGLNLYPRPDEKHP